MNLSVQELRKRHPRFIYHSSKYEFTDKKLRFFFKFELEPEVIFLPEVVINDIDEAKLKRLDQKVLDNFAFHLGLAEIPSYWKASCSPLIDIRAGVLDGFQLDWWKDLLIKGLGEFFFTNGIDFTEENFLTFQSQSNLSKNTNFFQGQLNPEKYLVPVGGGKDSAVTIELLKNSGISITPFVLNQIKSSLDVIKTAGVDQLITVNRKIDTKLLELNNSGYLNGHTPFTSLALFLISISAVIFDFKYVVNSNEKSADEENLLFKGQKINHQYSKGFEFEKKFREYSKKYLAADLEYFSFLRPIYELQIAKIFSSLSKYFSTFKSCNKGQKTSTWCQRCAKCLFVYLILYPFIDKQVLTSEIFSEDLFAKRELFPLLNKFIEQSEIKPFDCVGTRKETMLAVYLCLEKARQVKEGLPYLLQKVEEGKLIKLNNPELAKKELLEGWDNNNFIPENLENILKKYVIASVAEQSQ